MGESIGQPSGGSGGGSGVGAVNPGSGAAGFSSRVLVFGAANGSLTNNSSGPAWDSTLNNFGVGIASPTAKIHVLTTVNGNVVTIFGTTAGTLPIFSIESTGAAARIGFWTTVGSARPSSYTPGAVTTVGGRTLATTISTIGALMAAAEREEFNALVSNVRTLVQDFAQYGLLST